MAIKTLTRVCVCVCGVCVCVFVPRMSIYFVPRFQIIIQFNKNQNLNKNAWDWPRKSKTKFSGSCVFCVLYLWLVTFIATSCMFGGMDIEWSTAGDLNGGNPCFVEQRATKRARIMSWGLLKKQSSLVIILPWINKNDWISILRQVMMIDLLWISYIKSYPKGSMGLEYFVY